MNRYIDMNELSKIYLNILLEEDENSADPTTNNATASSTQPAAAVDLFASPKSKLNNINVKITDFDVFADFEDLDSTKKNLLSEIKEGESISIKDLINILIQFKPEEKKKKLSEKKLLELEKNIDTEASYGKFKNLKYDVQVFLLANLNCTARYHGMKYAKEEFAKLMKVPYAGKDADEIISNMEKIKYNWRNENPPSNSNKGKVTDIAIASAESGAEAIS